MFTDAADLIDAIEGNQGEEVQQEALDFAEEAGLLDQWQAEAAEGDDDQYTAAMLEEFARVEQQIGRQLTQGEINGMLATLSTEDLNQNVVPDFHAEFGQQLSSARNHEDGRLHLGEEAARRTFEEQGRGPEGQDAGPQPQFQRPEYDDDVQGD